MVEQQLDEFLSGEGYVKVPSNLPEFIFYFRMENHYVNVFYVIHYRDKLYITEEQFEGIKQKIYGFFAEKNISDVHILSVIICGDREKAKRLCQGDAFRWIIDPFCNKLIIYENQVSDFYGMKNKVEDFLSNIPQSGQANETGEGSRYGKETGSERGSRYEREMGTGRGAGAEIRKKLAGYDIPYVTVSVVVINIFLFMICTITGQVLYNKGAFNAGQFLEGKEYYRILTSIFLHWDINHLFSNMIMLYYLGGVVEDYFGGVKYGILYLVSGMAGNLLSLCYEVHTGALIRSVGASGAVFGIIGALLILVCMHKGNFEHITMTRLLIMIFYSLYSGFSGSSINNAAHIGGFIGGALVSILLKVTGRRL